MTAGPSVDAESSSSNVTSSPSKSSSHRRHISVASALIVDLSRIADYRINVASSCFDASCSNTEPQVVGTRERECVVHGVRDTRVNVRPNVSIHVTNFSWYAETYHPRNRRQYDLAAVASRSNLLVSVGSRKHGGNGRGEAGRKYHLLLFQSGVVVSRHTSGNFAVTMNTKNTSCHMYMVCTQTVEVCIIFNRCTMMLLTLLMLSMLRVR